MIKNLSRCIREYKPYAILAPLMMAGEVAMEVLIPTLMADLIAAHPEDAEELQGLLEYTDEAAQQAWENTYAMNFYTDENGDEQPAPAAEQNANFDKAEVYKDATILSILNDYRGDAPYEFHYNAQ